MFSQNNNLFKHKGHKEQLISFLFSLKEHKKTTVAENVSNFMTEQRNLLSKGKSQCNFPNNSSRNVSLRRTKFNNFWHFKVLKKYL